MGINDRYARRGKTGTPLFSALQTGEVDTNEKTPRTQTPNVRLTSITAPIAPIRRLLIGPTKRKAGRPRRVH